MKRSDVNEIISLMNRNDNMCQGAPQQVANGFYRLFDILELIAGALDEKRSYSREVINIKSTLNSNERLCQSAPQQSANGSYRVVELLGVIVNILDKNGSSIRSVASVKTSLSTNEIYCQSAPQQIANASYRIAEMLQVLVRTIASDISLKADFAINAMNRANAMLQGAPQQSANGMEASAEIVSLLVKHLDKKGRYTSTLFRITSLMSRNNAMCQGADQQTANYLYRIVEMVQLITNIMLDQLEQRTEEYWQAHKEEKKELLAQIAEYEGKIKKIKAEASAVNANEELAPLQTEVAALTSKMNAHGSEDIRALTKEVSDREAERAAIGFFKFSERKAAAARIEEAQEKLAAKKREVDREKAAIQRQIDEKNKEIKKINSRVEQQRGAILIGCDVYREKIEAIRYELTRQR